MKMFVHLYDFQLLSGSIESDNHNGATENLRNARINSYNEKFLQF